MPIFTYIIIALLLAIFIGMVFLFRRRPTPSANEGSFLLMQQQLQELARLVDQKTNATHEAMNQTQQSLHQTIQSQFGQSVKIITDITERLTKLDETNKQVIGFATQLQNLENILQNPKQRGILGEYYLENVLKNVLPPGTYQMQYKFSYRHIFYLSVFF